MDQLTLSIRSATNADCNGIIALVDSILGEWDDSVCLENAESDLLDIETNYFAKGGAFWVLTVDEHDEQRIVGSHGAMPGGESENACHFRRLYLHPDLRGTQWSHRLMQTTIDWGREQGFERVEFWSDSRFDRAHRFFSKFGFQRDGRTREMHDSHESYDEHFFFLEL